MEEACFKRERVWRRGLLSEFLVEMGAGVSGPNRTGSMSEDFLTVDQVRLLAEASGMEWTDADAEKHADQDGLMTRVNALDLLDVRMKRARKDLIEHDRAARTSFQKGDSEGARTHIRRRSDARQVIDAGSDLKSASDFHQALQRRRAESAARKVDQATATEEGLEELRRELRELEVDND